MKAIPCDDCGKPCGIFICTACYEEAKNFGLKNRQYTFTFEEIKALIESEPEYPTPWPQDKEEHYRELGVTYQLMAKVAVSMTKKELIKRLNEVKEKCDNEKTCT